MNFPNTQRTGTLGELAVESLFTSWSWTVGKDRIDVGYDHIVEPDRDKFLGARFLVQTKGSVSSVVHRTGVLRVPVSKSRLREYAKNPHPVFIVRATRSGVLYWVHAQEWCARNSGKIAGRGNVRVDIPLSNVLEDRASFEEYLSGIIPANVISEYSLPSQISARSRYLSSIDPRLSVEVSASRSGESYKISKGASEEPIDLHVQFKLAAATEGDLKGLNELRDFGLPLKVPVKDFQVTGSDLLPKIGMTRPIAGQIEISPARATSARVVLSTNASLGLTAQVALSVAMTRGEKGVAFSCDEPPIRSRFLLHADGAKVQCDINFSLAEDALADQPIASIRSLQEWGAWSEQALQHGRFYLTIEKNGSRMSTIADFSKTDLPGFLRYISMLSKVRALADYSGCGYVYRASDFGPDDSWAADAALRVLRGERVPSRIRKLSFSPGVNPAVIQQEDGPLYMETSFEIRLGQTRLINVPVLISFVGFRKSIRSDGEIEIEESDSSESWMMYRESSAVPDAAVGGQPVVAG